MKETSRFLKSLGLTSPTLMLDVPQTRANIARMAEKARQAGVDFRPHFKTHQSAAVGEWFRDLGVRTITVSSLAMARYFADCGWNDITLAVTANILERSRIDDLAGRIALHLTVDSRTAIEALAAGLTHRLEVWLKIDTGAGRTGVRWDQVDEAAALAAAVEAAPRLKLAGVLTHSGHSYRAGGPEEIRRVYSESVSRLLAVRRILLERGIAAGRVSYGDTPTCRLEDRFEGLDEIRPGVFVFYDLMQAELGVCADSEIAAAAACPVIGKYEARKQVVIHGGAVHLSKEALFDGSGRPYFGCLASRRDGRLVVHREAPVVSLSQEHGTVQLSDEMFDRVGIGDMVLVVPAHTCLTCDLYASYTTYEGERIPKLWRE